MSPSRISLCYVALAALALLVYGPALGGEFLWDDTDWIRDNETLRSFGGLGRIWFEPGAVIQYYPLTYTSWWLDCQLWDLSPTIMHVENVLLHAANALLFGLLLVRMKLPGAAFAAVLFLVHPVHSESVAWLVERKNTLSGLFYLWACHAWLTHLSAPTNKSLLKTAVLYALALLAKTATLMLPVTMFAIAVWQRREWRTPLRQLLPFVGMALFAAVFTIIMERGEGAVGYDWALQPLERLALLGQVLAFYLGKLLVPIGLSFSYAKWPVTGETMSWVPTLILTVTMLASAAVVIRARKPALLAGSLALWVYVANLLPVSGLVDYYYLRYAYAADHFQYLPSLGPIALIACSLGYVLRKPQALAGVAGVVCLLLAVATWRRASIYQNVEGLWRATIAAAPDSWLAHSNLANLLDQREPDAGIEHHRRALEIYPDAFEDNNAVGNYHARHGRFAEAKSCFDRALKVKPEDPLTYNNLGAMYGMQGNYADARSCFEEGHRRSPDNRDLLRNLAVVLSQAPDAAVRDGKQALRLARKLNAVDAPSLADEHVLFRALLLGGDRAEAIARGERVLRRAQREGDQRLANRVGSQLQRLQR